MPAGYASRVAATGLANGIVSALCAALALPMLVSALGLARYGQWAVLGMFITAAAALDLGMTRAIILHCAGQPAARVRECTTAATLIAGSFALLATLVIAIVSFGTGRLLGLAPQAFDTSILAGGCLILAFSQLNGVLRAVLESQLAVHWVNVGYLLQTLLLYGLTLSAALFWPGGVIVASTGAFAGILVLHAVLLARAGLLKPLRPSPAIFCEMLKTARGSYLLAAPSALLPPLASMLVLSAVTDSGAYGVFDLAVRIATLASTLLASIAVPMLALSARAHATGVGAAQLRGWVSRYLLVGWALFALGMTTFWLAGPWLLGRLFPAAGGALFPVALALLAGIGCVAASEPAIRAMLGSHQARPVLLARFLMLGVVLCAGTWSLHRGGLTAFAHTYLLAGVLCTATIIGAWWLRQRRPAR
jgi:hypothetical protein